MTIYGNQKLIESQGEDITCRALVETICDVRQLLGKNSKAGRNTDKTALGLVQPDTFAGTCYNCGKRRHRSVKYPSKGTQSSSGKICKVCGILGHATEDYWENLKNEGKMCKKWVSTKKRKTGEASGSHLEIFL